MTMSIDLLQWPAMAVTIAAAWFVASSAKRKRTVGFWLFLLSNVLWSVWGWYQQAYALVLLQIFLAVTNVRGVYKNDPDLTVTKTALQESTPKP